MLLLCPSPNYPEYPKLPNYLSSTPHPLQGASPRSADLRPPPAVGVAGGTGLGFLFLPNSNWHGSARCGSKVQGCPAAGSAHGLPRQPQGPFRCPGKGGGCFPLQAVVSTHHPMAAPNAGDGPQPLLAENSSTRQQRKHRAAQTLSPSSLSLVFPERAVRGALGCFSPHTAPACSHINSSGHLKSCQQGVTLRGPQHLKTGTSELSGTGGQL